MKRKLFSMTGALTVLLAFMVLAGCEDPNGGWGGGGGKFLDGLIICYAEGQGDSEISTAITADELTAFLPTPNASGGLILENSERQWNKDGTPIAGETGSRLSPNAAGA
jgi:hypothetical protein